MSQHSAAELTEQYLQDNNPKLNLTLIPHDTYSKLNITHNHQQNHFKPTKPKHNLPNKITANSLDTIATKKIKSLDSFSLLCDRILSQTQKINTLFHQNISSQQTNQSKPSEQEKSLIYDPHYHTGFIEDYVSVSSEEEKRVFGLGDQGRCQHFTLNKDFIVVIVGRLPTDYSNGLKIGLYLPRQLVENRSPVIQNKQLVIIQRRSKNNDSNFLNYPYIIVEPQVLLYPSYLCSWIECKRRVSLVNYISSEFEVNQHLVFGSACHRYMEWLLDGQVKVQLDSYHQWRDDVIRKVYDSFLYDMYLVKATFERFFQYCQQSLTNIREWVRMFIINKKELEVNKYQRLYLRVEKVVGSETMHRSGYFGLKGKTDGLFRGKLINKKLNTVTEVNIPFELKTGKKPSESHKRQTDIYNMLLREREKMPVIGLLYYSETNISIFRQESKQVAFETLVIHRNTIVMNLKRLYSGEEIELPQLSTNGDNCKLCEMAVACEVVEQSKRRKMIERNKGKRSNKNREQQQQLQQRSGQQHSQNQQRQKNNLLNYNVNERAMLLESLFQSDQQQQQPQMKDQHQNNPNKSKKNIMLSSNHQVSQKDDHNHQPYRDDNNHNLQIEDKQQLPLPSVHNSNAKATLEQLTIHERMYFTRWLQMLHLQQLESKQQLERQSSEGLGDFSLSVEQLRKIEAYFHQSKIQSKLIFSVYKRYRSVQQLHRLQNMFTVGMKLRVLIPHLNIMEGCKILKVSKDNIKYLNQGQLKQSNGEKSTQLNRQQHHIQSNKYKPQQSNRQQTISSNKQQSIQSNKQQNGQFLRVTLQMNSLQIIMNSKALQYSLLNQVQHDVELERFQSGQVPSWRWVIYRFVIGSPNTINSSHCQRLKRLVIDQYQGKSEYTVADIGRRGEGMMPEQQHFKGTKLCLRQQLPVQMAASKVNIDKITNIKEQTISKQTQSTTDSINGNLLDKPQSKRQTALLANYQQHTVIDITDSDDDDLQQQKPSLQNQSTNSPFISKLNAHQLTAFSKVFAAESYLTLVEGMPGTGKTELILSIILNAYINNLTVLITTYTNRSLDNILQRLFKQPDLPIRQSDVIREGSRYSIDPRFQKLNHRHYEFRTIQEYTKYFNEKKLWFVTLSSINIHHIPKNFDLVILDEASQSLEPVCLEALCRGSKLVMIGDYKQLQPIVKSKKAHQLGMGVSLFERLCIKYPHLTVALKSQYRMNRQIMKLSNKLVYEGELQMGSEQVANKQLRLLPQWQTLIPQQPLLFEILSPTNSVTFLSHDGITNSLSSKHRSKYHEMTHVLEVETGVFLYEKLVELGVNKEDIQIVCVYNRTVDVVNEMVRKKLQSIRAIRQQQKLGCIKSKGTVQQQQISGCINKDSQAISVSNLDDSMQSQIIPAQISRFEKQNSYLPALTIDKSQGIDKEVIIFLVQAHSLLEKQKDDSQSHKQSNQTTIQKDKYQTQRNPNNKDRSHRNCMLENSRRMNVALTRAKTKLILIGSLGHLKAMHLWGGQLAEMIQSNQQVCSLTKSLIDCILKEFSNSLRVNNSKNRQNHSIDSIQKIQSDISQI